MVWYRVCDARTAIHLVYTFLEEIFFEKQIAKIIISITTGGLLLDF